MKHYVFECINFQFINSPYILPILEMDMEVFITSPCSKSKSFLTPPFIRMIDEMAI